MKSVTQHKRLVFHARIAKIEDRYKKFKYLVAKRRARHAVYLAKRNVEEMFASVKYNEGNMFCVPKEMRTGNQDW